MTRAGLSGLVGLSLAATLAAGCGGSSAGEIRVTWSLEQNGVPVQCVPGDEVEVRVDTDAMTVAFPCGDGEGVTPALTCGVSHSVSVRLVDRDGNLISSVVPMNVLVPCGTTVNTTPVIFDVGCADGEIKTSWVLNGGANECLPGDVVSLQVDDASMIVDFNCSAHAGTTPAVQGNVTHVLTYTLSDAQGKVLATAGPFQLAVACGSSTATPNVDFPVK